MKQFEILTQTAKKIYQIMSECNIQLHESEESYLSQFKPQLMEIVYSWCKGSSFQSVCEQTEIYEGTIIRSIRREYELLK